MTADNIEALAYLIDVARFHNTKLKIMFTYLVQKSYLIPSKDLDQTSLLLKEKGFKWICRSFNVEGMTNGVKNHLLEHYPFYRFLLGSDGRNHDTVLGESYQKDAGKGSYARTNKQQNTALRQMMLDQIRKKAIEVIVKIRKLKGVFDTEDLDDDNRERYVFESLRGSCHNELIYNTDDNTWDFKGDDEIHYIHPLLDGCNLMDFLSHISDFYIKRNLKIHFLETVKVTSPSHSLDGPKHFFIRYYEYHCFCTYFH